MKSAVKADSKDLKALIQRAEQLADMVKAEPLGKFTLFRAESHWPVPCFLEVNCKDNVYLIFFGLYYDIFQFRFQEGKILFKGTLEETRQYLESALMSDILPLRALLPAPFLARANPMPHGDMGLCDDRFVESIELYDGVANVDFCGRIDALGASKHRRALDVLKPLLKSPRVSVRMHALTAILSLHIPENEKLRAILLTLDDPETAIRTLSKHCAKIMFETSPFA